MSSGPARGSAQGEAPRPRRRPGENRAGLLAAGSIEFGLRGYFGAQTSAIAARAGVSQPNVYANFSSKRELFLACLAQLTHETNSPPSSGSRTHGSEEAQLGVTNRLTDRQAMLLFQAVAAVREPALHEDLALLLQELRVILGPVSFDASLRAGACALLGQAFDTTE